VAKRPDGRPLLVAAEWIEAHCVVPDGFDAGQPFIMPTWQLRFVADHYTVKGDAPWRPDNPVRGPAFVNRRSQLVMPQKAGKGPLTAAFICLEGVGPALFGGWAGDDDGFACAEHGCGCGWEYPYEPGEPMGMLWPTPLIQVTATAEEQTGNVYDALRPMIEQGPLADLGIKTGELFTRLPRGGRIDTVTSKATTRLGQRTTFAVQDETGVWTSTNGMIKLAETQRRGLAGMGGRAVETTNGWDPSEQSVAQRTAEATTGDINRYHPLPPAGLSYMNKRERRKIHKHVYADCPWVDLDAIESEAAEIIVVDPSQAERFFGNRVVAGSGSAYNGDRWVELATPDYRPEPGCLVTVGVDGARFDDALAIVGTEVETGFQWAIHIQEAPRPTPPDYEHDLKLADGALSEVFDTFSVWRCYIDPQKIGNLVSTWQGRWGEDKVLPWWTNRPKPMGYAVREHVESVHAGDLTHDGDETFARHIRNCVKRATNAKDEDGRTLWLLYKDGQNSPRKIDAGPAAVLSWRARNDAIAAGATAEQEVHYAYGF
jgi:hypothetical protein